jgi:hypothetical protein
MRLVCNTKKEAFKNLTIGTEYEAIEEGDIYIVTNDAGLRSRYTKNYFRVIPPTPVTRPLSDAIRIDISRDSDTITILANIDARELFYIDLIVDSTTNSCGIQEIQGLSGLKYAITKLMNDGRRINHTLVIGTKEDLFDIIISQLIIYLNAHYPAAFYMFTDVKQKVDDLEVVNFDDIMEAHSTIFNYALNPNSDNTIGIWIVKRIEE